MRLSCFHTDDGLHRGVWVDGRWKDLTIALGDPPGDLRPWIGDWPSASARIESALADAPLVDLSATRYAPPVTEPQKILCVGRNYAEHAIEQGADVPEEPVIFNKLPTALLGHREAIQLPPISNQVDFEAELVVIIGRGGRNIPRERAASHLFGVCCGNDITARDWQKGRPGGQWLLGKSFDTFAPLGPTVVTADEWSLQTDWQIRLTLNGRQMQQGNSRQLLYPIDSLIAHVSRFCTLTPGDLLFTGTPPGVGVARDPPVFLKPGDIVEVEIEGIGKLTNTVVSEAT